MIETDDVVELGASIRDRVPWGTIANVVGLVVLLAIVVPFAIYAVPQVVGAEQSYVVLSGSMEPAISPGDAIVVNDVEPSVVEEGDVITFSRSGEARTTTHRVTGVVERDGELAFETKGDANEDVDRELVSGAQLEGRLLSAGGHLFAIPYVGYVIRFAGTQAGLALFVFAPLALLVVTEIRDIVTSTRSESAESDDDAGADGDPGGSGDSDDRRNSGAVDREETWFDALDNETGDALDDETVDPLDDEGLGFDAVDGTGSETTADAAETPDGGVTIRSAELGLALAVLGAFLAYSVWVAYVAVTPWAIGVAASVAAAFALLGGLYAFGGSDDAELASAASVVDGGDVSATSPAGTAPADETVERPSFRREERERREATDGPTPGDETLSERWTDDEGEPQPTIVEGSPLESIRSSAETVTGAETAGDVDDDPPRGGGTR